MTKTDQWIDVPFSLGLREYNRTGDTNAQNTPNFREYYQPGECQALVNMDVTKAGLMTRRTIEDFYTSATSVVAGTHNLLGVVQNPTNGGGEEDLPVYYYQLTAGSKHTIYVPGLTDTSAYSAGSGSPGGVLRCVVDLNTYSSYYVLGAGGKGGAITAYNWNYFIEDTTTPETDWAYFWRDRIFAISKAGRISYSAPGPSVGAGWDTSVGGGYIDTGMRVRFAIVYADALYVFSATETMVFTFPGGDPADGALMPISTQQGAYTGQIQRGQLVLFGENGAFTLSGGEFNTDIDRLGGSYIDAVSCPIGNDTIVFTVSRYTDRPTAENSTAVTFRTYAFNVDTGAWSEYRMPGIIKRRTGAGVDHVIGHGFQARTFSQSKTIFQMYDIYGGGFAKTAYFMKTNADRSRCRVADYITSPSAKTAKVRVRLVVPVDPFPESPLTWVKYRQGIVVGHFDTLTMDTYLFHGPQPVGSMGEEAISAATGRRIITMSKADTGPIMQRFGMNYRGRRIYIGFDANPFDEGTATDGTTVSGTNSPGQILVERISILATPTRGIESNAASGTSIP